MSIRTATLGNALLLGVIPYAIVVGGAVASEDVGQLMLRTQFEYLQANSMGEVCSAYEFDERAYRISMQLLDQQLNLQGKTLASETIRYTEEAFDELYVAFEERHGLTATSRLRDYCSAAEREFVEQTPIGKLLRKAN